MGGTDRQTDGKEYSYIPLSGFIDRDKNNKDILLNKDGGSMAWRWASLACIYSLSSL